MNKYTITHFSYEEYFGYRIRLNVSEKLIVSLVAGKSAYSTPRENISNISDYKEWECAYFYQNNTPMYLKYNASYEISSIEKSTEIDPDAYVTLEDIEKTINKILELM